MFLIILIVSLILPHNLVSFQNEIMKKDEILENFTHALATFILIQILSNYYEIKT